MAKKKNQFHWDTKVVKQYIEANIANVNRVVINKAAGGDWDSLGMVVKLTNGKSLHITPWRDYIDNIREAPQVLDDVDIKFIEMSDSDADDRGGLGTRNKKLAQAYIDVRQYFLDNGIEDVIPNYDTIY